MRPTDRNGVAVMLSVALACLTLRPLTSDGSYLGLGWMLIVLIGGFSLLLRRLGVGGSAVLAVQAAIWVLFSLGLSLVTPGNDSPWYIGYADLWADGIEHMRTQASPMDPNDGTRLIFVTIIGLIMIMTDLLVNGIHRPAWAIAPPATLFLVPALGLGTDTGLVSFGLIGVGYLAILVADGLNTAARWTRGLSRDSAVGFDEAGTVVWRAATYLAAPALATTVLLGFALPTLSLPGFGFGTGGSGGPLQLTDPTLDLKRNLNQPNDRTVIEYQSGSKGGVYLKMATLPNFSAAGWTNVEIGLSAGNQLGDIPGLAVVPPARRTTKIQVRDFRSQYLPLPYATRSFQAEGDWRYDADSLVVINAHSRADDLRNLSYSAVSVDIAPTAAEMRTATAGKPPDADITAAIPPDLPQPLIDEARRVTKNAGTPAARAAAIQSYLRSSRFTYSTQQLPGNGYEALENFLLHDHQGYCEQFASSMAMMARVVGIPARVSVGFLPGDQVGDVWKVSINDMHAWPELYFAPYGWVRYEPTPAGVTGQIPAWSVQPDDNTDDDPTADPSVSSSTRPTAKAEPTQLPQAPNTTNQPAGAGRGRTVLWLVGGLVVLLILAAPATIRVRRRTVRLNDDGEAEDRVENAWAEIRDTVVDHGGSWPRGSPRAIGTELATRLDHDEADSMGRVATLVERARYARAFADTEAASQLPAVTQEIRRGIAAPSSPVRKVLAVLLPRSLFPRRPRRR
jgi:transglutaminase-like putative cysteine protease